MTHMNLRVLSSEMRSACVVVVDAGAVVRPNPADLLGQGDVYELPLGVNDYAALQQHLVSLGLAQHGSQFSTLREMQFGSSAPTYVWVPFSQGQSLPSESLLYVKIQRLADSQQQRPKSLKDIFGEWESSHAGFIHAFSKQPMLARTSLGVTADRDGTRASLLLHALEAQWTRNSMVWSMVEGDRRRCIPLMGVSGCGKTRLLYEVLAQKWGFYWTATATRNGGSTDVSLVGRESGDGDPGCVKHYAAVSFMSKLILARLLVLRYARRVMPQLTPQQWLLLQTEFRRYGGESVDPYLKLASMLETGYELGKGAWELYNVWCEVVSELKCKPIFVMDEAQNLQSANCFLSPDSLQLRSRFSPIIKALLSTQLDATVCIAGTGISFLQLEESIRSLVAKDAGGYPQFVTEFNRWEEVEEVYDFCEKYLPGLRLTKENCSRLLKKLRGRKRCLVTCLERLMLKGVWSDAVVDKFYADLTTKNSQDYAMSLYTVVAQFFQSGKGTFRCRGKDLSASALVLRIVDHHLFSGRAAFVLEASEADLVESGIGWCRNLAGLGEASTYIVDEPMVMDAMANYCEEHGHIQRHLKALMDSVKDDPGACGNIWERVVVCHAGSIFDGTRTLDAWGCFRDVQWGGIFHGSVTPELLGVKGPVWRESAVAPLTEYLSMPAGRRPQFFMFSPLSGPDVMAFVRLCGCEIPVFFQLKLHYVVKWEDAESTTNPLKMYRRSKEHREVFHSKMLEACKGGCMSLVVAYPAATKKPPSCTLQSGQLGGSFRLVGHLGKEEVEKLFSKGLCDFLERIKPETIQYREYKELVKKSGIRSKRLKRQDYDGKFYML